MWPTRSRVSQPVQRVSTFQFFGSETMRVKLSRSRRRTCMTVSLPSADIGLTGVMTAVLIGSLPSHFFCNRHDERRKCAVQLLAANLEPGRKAELRAQLLRLLVDREARTVGRDLEENAAGLAVVDRLEVPAVDHRCDVAARC